MRKKSTDRPEVVATLAVASEQTEIMRSLLARVVREEGMTLRDLGRRTGRSEDYWSKLLRGLHKLHVEHVFQVLEVLGVASEHFFARLHGGRGPGAFTGSRLGLREAVQILALAGPAAQVILRLAEQAGLLTIDSEASRPEDFGKEGSPPIES